MIRQFGTFRHWSHVTDRDVSKSQLVAEKQSDNCWRAGVFSLLTVDFLIATIIINAIQILSASPQGH